MSIPIKHYQSEIDGLRMIAVMAVTLYHLRVSGFSGGYTGVDMFFVISGYLITGNIIKELQTQSFSFSLFYAKRIRRIFPALLTTVMFTTSIALFIASPLFALETSKEALATLLSAANIYFWYGSGYFDTDAYTKPLLHMWSLGVEEQFYIIWPITLYLATQINAKIRLWVIFICILAGTIISNSFLSTDPSAVFSFFLFEYLN